MVITVDLLLVSTASSGLTTASLLVSASVFRCSPLYNINEHMGQFYRCVFCFGRVVSIAEGSDILNASLRTLVRKARIIGVSRCILSVILGR